MTANRKTKLLRFAAWKSNLVSKIQANNTNFLHQLQSIASLPGFPFICTLGYLAVLLLCWGVLR
jgi:hypothetical protein